VLPYHQSRRLVCAFALLWGGAATPGWAGCAPELIGGGTVRAVLDGRTLQLADGREVRLAGIEVPAGEDLGADPARAALAQLATGEITLKGSGLGTDRYGRVVAYVFAPGETQSAQRALLRQGHARVAARVGDAGCAADLLAAERAARAARLGLWGDPYYALRRTERPSEISAERGRFTLVEGRVLSVRESGATIYVNFGPRWSEDFTVTVLRRHERAFASAGMDVKKLQGRHVRVRGFVEERGGPWIEASRPEQIEIAERN
jgi:endonuclease YncB( thermonuclease family)